MITNNGFKKGDKHWNWKGGINAAHKKIYDKKWYAENQDLIKYYRRQYYYRKRGAEGSHTLDEWETLKAQYNFTCPCCKKSDVKLEADHIIPISKGGSNNIENIQPLCRNCNAKKHASIIKY